MFSAYPIQQEVAKWFTSLADETPADKRKNIVMLQWLVAIATSYLSLFSGGSINDDPLVIALVAGLILTGLVFQKLPESILLSTRFSSLLVVSDLFLFCSLSASIASLLGI